MRSHWYVILLLFLPLVAKGESWYALVKAAQQAEPQQQLKLINGYFNQQIRYRDELGDYWQSLNETLESRAGDCEDFALGKYQTFLASGNQAQHFSFVYALRKSDGVAHIALLHKPSNLLLDNLTDELSPIAHRQDLSPVLEFTARSYQLLTPNTHLTRAELVSLQRWQKVLKQAEQPMLKVQYD